MLSNTYKRELLLRASKTKVNLRKANDRRYRETNMQKTKKKGSEEEKGGASPMEELLMGGAIVQQSMRRSLRELMHRKSCRK